MICCCCCWMHGWSSHGEGAEDSNERRSIYSERLFNHILISNGGGGDSLLVWASDGLFKTNATNVAAASRPRPVVAYCTYSHRARSVPQLDAADPRSHLAGRRIDAEAVVAYIIIGHDACKSPRKWNIRNTNITNSERQHRQQQRGDAGGSGVDLYGDVRRPAAVAYAVLDPGDGARNKQQQQHSTAQQHHFFVNVTVGFNNWRVSVSQSVVSSLRHHF